MSLSSVDLPQPEGPSSTTKSPASAVKLISFSALNAPNDLLTFSSCRNGIVLSLDRAARDAGVDEALQEEEADQRRQDDDDHRRHDHRLADGVGDAGEVIEHDRHRALRRPAGVEEGSTKSL